MLLLIKSDSRRNVIVTMDGREVKRDARDGNRKLLIMMEEWHSVEAMGGWLSKREPKLVAVEKGTEQGI